MGEYFLNEGKSYCEGLLHYLGNYNFYRYRSCYIEEFDDEDIIEDLKNLGKYTQYGLVVHTRGGFDKNGDSTKKNGDYEHHPDFLYEEIDDTYKNFVFRISDANLEKYKNICENSNK